MSLKVVFIKFSVEMFEVSQHLFKILTNLYRNVLTFLNYPIKKLIGNSARNVCCECIRHLIKSIEVREHYPQDLISIN